MPKRHYTAGLIGLCLTFLDAGFIPTFASVADETPELLLAAGEVLTDSLCLNFASAAATIPSELRLTHARKALTKAVNLNEEGKPVYKQLYDFCQFVRSILSQMPLTKNTQEVYQGAESELGKSVTISLWTDLGEDQKRTKRKCSSWEEFDQNLCDASFQKYLQPSYLRGVDYLLFGSNAILQLHYPKSTSPDIKLTESCSIVFSNFITMPSPSLFSTAVTTTAKPYLTSYSLLGGALEKLIYSPLNEGAEEKPMADIIFTTLLLFTKMGHRPVFQDLPTKWTEGITYGGKLASKDISSLLATLAYALILEAKKDK